MNGVLCLVILSRIEHSQLCYILLMYVSKGIEIVYFSSMATSLAKCFSYNSMSPLS